MSKYTTGEIAKLCNVSVRTVQYYDSRNIVVPSELTEGGRRLYSEEDLKKMRIVCFLREMDFSINNIGDLLSEKDPGSFISLLMEQQEKALRQEVEERQTKLNMIEEMKRELQGMKDFTVESIGDIAHIMENKKKLRKVRGITLTVGIVMDIIEVATFILGITRGIWWPFVLGMAVVILMGIGVVRYYLKHVAYICPQCHSVFKADAKENFFARHTPTARKVTCTCCGHKGFCVETYGEEV